MSYLIVLFVFVPLAASCSPKVPEHPAEYLRRILEADQVQGLILRSLARSTDGGVGCLQSNIHFLVRFRVPGYSGLLVVCFCYERPAKLQLKVLMWFELRMPRAQCERNGDKICLPEQCRILVNSDSNSFSTWTPHNCTILCLWELTTAKPARHIQKTYTKMHN